MFDHNHHRVYNDLHDDTIWDGVKDLIFRGLATYVLIWLACVGLIVGMVLTWKVIGVYTIFVMPTAAAAVGAYVLVRGLTPAR